MKISLTPLTLLFLLTAALTPLKLKGMERVLPDKGNILGETSGDRDSANYEAEERRLTDDDGSDNSQLSSSSRPPTDAQSTSNATEQNAPQNGLNVPVALLDHHFIRMLQGVPQKIAELQQKVEATTAPIFELKNEAQKNIAAHYLGAPTNEERKTCLQELGAGPKADKLRERLIYIQNLKSAAMLLEQAKKHVVDFSAAIENSQGRPAELAVYLSGFTNVEKRVNALQQHADNIVEINDKIIKWRKKLAETTAENKFYHKWVLSQMLKTAQQSIDDASLFGARAINYPRSAREYRLAAEATNHKITLFQDLLELSPAEGVNLVPQAGTVMHFLEGIPIFWNSSEEFQKYNIGSNTVRLLGYEVFFRRRAAKFEIESPALAVPCKEVAFTYSEAVRYGVSYVENKINNPSLSRRHGILANAYSELAECQKIRVGDSTSVMAPNEEEIAALEKVNQLLRKEENGESASVAALSSSSSYSSSNRNDELDGTEK